MRQVLLVDDNSADVALMRRSFSERAPELQLCVAQTIAEARKRLASAAIDAVVVDHTLPDGSGVELVPAARESSCSVIVLLNPVAESHVVLDELRAVNEDCIIRSGMPGAALPRVVQRALREADLVRENLRHRERLELTEARLRAYASLASDWFWEAGRDMKITWLSEGATRPESGHAAAYIGQPLPSLCGHSRDASFDWTAIEKLWCEGREFELEVPVGRSAQDARVVQLRARPFRDATGRIAGYRGIGRDITRERESLREITYLAMRDPLTGALNRRSLEVEVGHALAGVVCNAEEHVFCAFDLDRFKSIDARAGHQTGDRILREVATTLAHNVRVSDTIGRLGGDAFGVLLKHCGMPRAIEIATNIIGAVGKMFVPELPATLPITVSSGLVVLQPEHDIEHVLRDADRALAQAQKAGGGAVRCA